MERTANLRLFFCVDEFNVNFFTQTLHSHILQDNALFINIIQLTTL